MNTTALRHRILNGISFERTRQLSLWGPQYHKDGTGTKVYKDAALKAQAATNASVPAGSKKGDSDRWDLILLEEVYEALAESDPAKLDTELVQAGAVIVAWLEDLRSRP